MTGTHLDAQCDGYEHNNYEPHEIASLDLGRIFNARVRVLLDPRGDQEGETVQTKNREAMCGFYVCACACAGSRLVRVCASERDRQRICLCVGT